jgi:hypothetical protein
MKVYVAGASAEIERARRVRDALLRDGHEITFDWTTDFESNEGLSNAQRAAYADADFQGVVLANCLVLLVPIAPMLTQGAWWEGGVADARCIPIIASGRPEDRVKNIFLSRAIEVDTDEEAVAFCREDDVLRRFKEQTAELEHYRHRLGELEQLKRGLYSLIQRIDKISPTESEQLFARIIRR